MAKIHNSTQRHQQYRTKQQNIRERNLEHLQKPQAQNEGTYIAKSPILHGRLQVHRKEQYETSITEQNVHKKHQGHHVNVYT